MYYWTKPSTDLLCGTCQASSYLTCPVEHDEIFRWDLIQTTSHCPRWRHRTPSSTCLYGCPDMTASDHLPSPLLCCAASCSCFHLDPTTNARTAPALTQSSGLTSEACYTQKPGTTHNSGLFHLTMGSCGRCCRHPNKSPGRELNYSRAFLSACKNHQIFKKRPDAVICRLCEGRCFIFTHRPFRRGSGCLWLWSQRSFRFRGQDTKGENRVFSAAARQPQLCCEDLHSALPCYCTQGCVCVCMCVFPSYCF